MCCDKKFKISGKLNKDFKSLFVRIRDNFSRLHPKFAELLSISHFTYLC